MDLEDLDCSICRDIFKEPVALPDCQHVFCRQCIQSLVDAAHRETQSPRCPDCRCPIDLGKRGVFELPLQNRLKSMARKVKEENQQFIYHKSLHEHEEHCLRDIKLETKAAKETLTEKVKECEKTKTRILACSNICTELSTLIKKKKRLMLEEIEAAYFKALTKLKTWRNVAEAEVKQREEVQTSRHDQIMTLLVEKQAEIDRIIESSKSLSSEPDHSLLKEITQSRTRIDTHLEKWIGFIQDKESDVETLRRSVEEERVTPRYLRVSECSTGQSTFPKKKCFPTLSSSATMFGTGAFSASDTTPSNRVDYQKGQRMATRPSGGLVGSAASATTPIRGLFGSATVETTTGGGLFGSATTASGDLFGSIAAATMASDLFRSTTTARESIEAPFGSATTAKTAGGGLFATTVSPGLFGSNTSAGTVSGNLFGHARMATTANFGLFGSAAITATSASGCMFGSAKTTTADGGLFGTHAVSSRADGFGTGSSGGLFGTSKTSSSTGVVFGPNTAGLFDANPTPPTSGAVFGAKVSSPSPAVFGSNPGCSSVGFGASRCGSGSANSGFLGELGVKLNAENASQNVLRPPTFRIPSTSSANLFGSQGSAVGSSTRATSSGFESDNGSGEFTSAGPSVATTGFACNTETRFGVSPHTKSNLFGSQGSAVGSSTRATSSGFESDNASGGFTSGGPSVATAGFACNTEASFSVSPHTKYTFGGSPVFASTPALGGINTFGAISAFGTSPVFGGTRHVFGSTSTFGTSPGPSGGRIFGSTQTTTSGFAGMANTSGPTFRSLAQNTASTGFGSLAQNAGFKEDASSSTVGFDSPSFG
ncbi:nuclear pore complex protein DDB_G0274915-like [Liolophura sinensis]|uniref:nuclear pore complex protein DDB_G0274915-like n=1 Tax=Liolophura sinensis TaxID=3198878 RepID=UPI00315920D8